MHSATFTAQGVAKILYCVSNKEGGHSFQLVFAALLRWLSHARSLCGVQSGGAIQVLDSGSLLLSEADNTATPGTPNTFNGNTAPLGGAVMIDQAAAQVCGFRGASNAAVSTRKCTADSANEHEQWIPVTPGADPVRPVGSLF